MDIEQALVAVAFVRQQLLEADPGFLARNGSAEFLVRLERGEVTLLDIWRGI